MRDHLELLDFSIKEGVYIWCMLSCICFNLLLCVGQHSEEESPQNCQTRVYLWTVSTTGVASLVDRQDVLSYRWDSILRLKLTDDTTAGASEFKPWDPWMQLHAEWRKKMNRDREADREWWLKRGTWIEDDQQSSSWVTSWGMQIELRTAVFYYQSRIDISLFFTASSVLKNKDKGAGWEALLVHPGSFSSK